MSAYGWLCRLSHHMTCKDVHVCACVDLHVLLWVSLSIYTCAGRWVDRYMGLYGCACTPSGSLCFCVTSLYVRACFQNR